MLSEFWQSLVGSAVVPRVVAGRVFEVITDDGDTDPDHPSEVPDWEGITPIAGVPCIIAYVDGKGTTSERLITCQRIDDHRGERYLWAYCHSRLAVRQFKLARVQQVSDAQTGEVFDCVDTFFGQFAADNVHRSQPGWGLSVNRKADFTALLNALVFIARCDRDYHPLERQSLEAFVGRYWIRSEALGDPDCDSILRYADKLAPDAEVFWVSLHRCAKNPLLLSLLRLSVRDIVDADGVIAAEEFYWGTKVDEFVASL